MQLMNRIAIVWWGAAWLMVAATIAQKAWDKAQIHLFEKNNQLGNKIRISGWGRCNITTWYYKKQDLETKYARWREFLSHAISQFSPRKMQQRCKENWLDILCQDDMRCFPASNKWSDVVAMFENILKKWQVTIHFSESVKSIVKKQSHLDTQNSSRQQEEQETDIENSIFKDKIDTNSSNIDISQEEKNKINTPNYGEKNTSCFILTTSKDTYEYDFVVITSWWNAYWQTGSTGDWYTLAESLGHTITPLGPSLNSFLTQEEWIKECSGISFSDATLWIEQVKASGPVLFTHFGISWPATFALSAHLPYIQINKTTPQTIYCKPFSDRPYQRWATFFTESVQNKPKQLLSTILEAYFPKRRVATFLTDLSERIGKDISQLQLANLSTELKKQLSHLLWDGFPITLIARRPWDEFVTAGWINADEVNPKTMESNLCPWLFFAGEILNIDGITWWFNFQAARSTWKCAGETIADSILFS